jgi:hypothetical protein
MVVDMSGNRPFGDVAEAGGGIEAAEQEEAEEAEQDACAEPCRTFQEDGDKEY